VVASRKIKRRAQRKNFKKSLKSRIKPKEKIEDIKVGPAVYGGFDRKETTGLEKAPRLKAKKLKTSPIEMKKSPYKMKGFSGFGNEKESPVQNKTILKTVDKISKKPASAGRKAITAASNVAKEFSSKTKSAMSQVRGNKVGTFNGRDVRFVKRVPGKFASSAHKTAMFRGIGKLAAPLTVASTLHGFYKAGKEKGFKPPSFKKATYNQPFNFKNNKK